MKFASCTEVSNKLDYIFSKTREIQEMNHFL